jgi:hypothetical protein
MAEGTKVTLVVGGLYMYDRQASKTGSGIAFCASVVDGTDGKRSGVFLMAHKVPKTYDETDVFIQKLRLIAVMPLIVKDVEAVAQLVKQNWILPEQLVEE